MIKYFHTLDVEVITKKVPINFESFQQLIETYKPTKIFYPSFSNTEPFFQIKYEGNKIFYNPWSFMPKPPKMKDHDFIPCNIEELYKILISIKLEEFYFEYSYII